MVKNVSYVKNRNENNPLVTQSYGADPGVIVYDDTIYIYTTNDSQEFRGDNENTYSKITSLNCYSSKDMVNWTDHGSFNIAGKNGAAKWSNNSWAPCIACKKIDGKDQFFLYFANSGNGIGVVTSDSPLGPWQDPVGGPLLTGATPGCQGVLWMFDPAVLVDEDGSAYLYFGGGVPQGQEAHPMTARVIKLGDDMISTVGEAATIDSPYMFEDSGINKIGDTYFYSYCSNFNCKDGFNNGAIQYMTSNSPMGPFTYKGEVLKNPGEFFPGSNGNNHHFIFEFKGKYYIAYHTRTVETREVGKSLGYRTTHIDPITVKDGEICPVTASLHGVEQVSYINPYETVQAETIFTQSGIKVEGNENGTAVVTDVEDDAYIIVKGVNFSKGLSSISFTAYSEDNGLIEVKENTPDGNLLGTIKVDNTYGKYMSFSGDMKNINTVTDLCFTLKGNMDLDYWVAK